MIEAWERRHRPGAGRATRSSRSCCRACAVSARPCCCWSSGPTPIEAGWPIELFEARPGGDLRAQVAEALPTMVRTVNRQWRNKERAKRIGRIAASFARMVQARLVHGGFRFEVEPEPGVADTGDLETDLTELLIALGEGAQSEGVGAALLIDELHEVPPLQLSALVGAAHRVNQEIAPRRHRRRRAAAGRAGASEARSYAERLFSIRPVGALPPEDTRAAFEEPAADLGVAFERTALDQLVEISGGYPFFIQSYGKHVWDVADDSPIAGDDVELCQPRLPRARRLVLPAALRPGDAGRAALPARWPTWSEGEVSSADVASALGTTSRAESRRSATGS